MTGDRIDHGACMNTLTTHRPSLFKKFISFPHNFLNWFTFE
ncbi:hypothetical protein ACTXQV_60390, partial [Klebsiella pneumoniae]